MSDMVSKKGTWTKEEERILTDLVKQVGTRNWILVSKHLPGRIAKQCRQHWYKCLDPNITKKNWTQEEDIKIVQLHQIYGNKWAKISREFCGRTDNAIKNRFNTNISKRLHTEPFRFILEETTTRKREVKQERKAEEFFQKCAVSSDTASEDSSPYFQREIDRELDSQLNSPKFPAKYQDHNNKISDVASICSVDSFKTRATPHKKNNTFYCNYSPYKNLQNSKT